MRSNIGLTALIAVTSTIVTQSLALPKAGWTRQRAKIQGRKVLSSSHDKRYANESEGCVVNSALATTAPKENIWQGLTAPEVASVIQWMFEQPDLNLTKTEDVGPWDNAISIIELMQPNKTAALTYIDDDGELPTRYAHVLINHRADENPYYQDILVGPLPVANGSTTWEPLEYPFTRKTEGKIRNLDADSDALYDEWFVSVSSSVSDITLDLWNATSLGLDNDTLEIWGIDPLYQEGDRIMRWDTFWKLPDEIFDSETLLPMGLFFMSDVTGRDSSKWTVEGWYYDGVFYETTDAFRTAYWNGEIKKLKGATDGPWAHTDQAGTIPPLDTTAPPISVAPQGSRLHVDSENKYVEWMGWSFYIGFNRDSGMSLHDVRYKGNRILYEIGLQEALAHYAGSDPTQSHTAYLDTYYGFGPYAFELLKGYDCPLYATYLNTSFYVSETTHTHLNSICMFEYDADYPMSRHSSSSYVASSKNIYFTVRSVSTVGNYDYMFSYTFYMDGSMGVEVRASGYIQSAYFAHNGDYGFKIHDSLSGSMHDHVLNYKADFDILGTNNTVEIMDQVPTTTTYPWSKGKVFNTMKVQRSFLETENDGKMNWDGQKQIFVVNQEERNKHGELRAYRVLPAAGVSHLTVKDSTIIKNSARWAEQDLMVTKRKDTEPRSAHPMNSQDTENPMVNFDKFFDGESLNQTDLVMWFNLGMHHVPHTGDLPNTVFTTAHSAVKFSPSNFFLESTNKETVNMVRVNYGDGKKAEVVSFGSADETCAYNYEPSFADLEDYKGDVVIRKFPYNPNDPFFETDGIV